MDRLLYDFDAQAKRAIDAAGLERGERVLLFCCGTGRELAAVRERIGAEGAIVGLDFSAAMLSQARRFVEEQGWTNVTLLEADVTASPLEASFDVGVCTLGMSIIPDWTAACRSLLASVRPGGRIVVADLQSAEGWRRMFNPLLAWWTRPYGGSAEGLANARALFQRLEHELELVASHTCGQGTYRLCVARKP